MLTVEDALSRLLALLSPLDVETVALEHAAGRALAEPVIATRDQPPFAASAMDGYAVRAADCAPGVALAIVGTAPAGRAWAGVVGAGQAVRIFTGAPIPEGADAILIQEDADRDGDGLTVREAPEAGAWIRPRGLDFAVGATIPAPRRLSPADLALAAAMNAPRLTVRRRPVVALIPTGDELVLPGETPAPDQIVASSGYGLAALIAAQGGVPRLCPIARDTIDSLREAFAAAEGADLIVTLGGASVGDFDLVREVVGDAALSFYKIAMRPGKPLMAGRVGGVPLLGMPGNPVSAMVCGCLFLRPALDALAGLPAGPLPRRTLPLAHAIGKGGPREHYMRARIVHGAVEVFRNQDSSVQSILSQADALAIQPVNGPALNGGDPIEVIDL
jgi:molybdopterin molybdotransferase